MQRSKIRLLKIGLRNCLKRSRGLIRVIKWQRKRQPICSRIDPDIMRIWWLRSNGMSFKINKNKIWKSGMRLRERKEIWQLNSVGISGKKTTKSKEITLGNWNKSLTWWRW